VAIYLESDRMQNIRLREEDFLSAERHTPKNAPTLIAY
jgi:hypothetical protein